jgi:MYXO-CTERM domain-containing protein
MSNRKSSATYQVHGVANRNRSSQNLGLRSSSRLNLGRATGGASALALVFAFLAPKPAAAVPFFEDLTATNLPAADPYCTNSGKIGCYTSWVVAADIDSDGDIDLLSANGGGYYKPNTTTNPDFPSVEPSTVYLNDGLGKFTDVTVPWFAGARSRLRQVGVADVNGDGLKDVYQPGGFALDPDKLWIQTAPGVFEDKASELLPAGLKSNTPAFHLGDLDGDGDIDLVTTDWYSASSNTPVFLSLYLNDGTGKFTLEEEEQDPEDWLKSDRLPPTIPFTANSGVPYWGSRAIDLDFADVDNDFDLDILVNMRNGISRLFLNNGKGYFKDGNGNVHFTIDPATGTQMTVSNYPMKRGPYVYNQELCDIDNDGDLDLVLDNAGARPTGGSSDYTQVNVNNGKGVFSDESRARIFGEPGSDDNAVKCVDVNNDGNYDLLVASLTGAREKLLLADGTGKFNAVLDGFPTVTDSTLGIDAADFDGDGLFDVFTGQGEGGNDWSERYYHGVTAADGTGAKPDTLPPTFRAIEKPAAVEGEPIVIRFAVRDAVTSETGDHVKNVAVVYSTPFGSSGKVAATFIGGDLFRAVIPAQEAKTVLTITPQATDRRNLKGFGAPVVVTVKAKSDGSGGSGGSGGGGGTSSAGSGGLAGDAGAAGDATGGIGGEPTTEPTAGTGGTGDPDPEPTAGTGGTEPGTAGSSMGASSGSGGTGAVSSEGGEPSEGGVPSTGGTTSGGSGSGSGDDDGCSVSSTASSSSSGSWIAALGLALMVGRRRRKVGP